MSVRSWRSYEKIGECGQSIKTCEDVFVQNVMAQPFDLLARITGFLMLEGISGVYR